MLLSKFFDFITKEAEFNIKRQNSRDQSMTYMCVLRLYISKHTIGSHWRNAKQKQRLKKKCWGASCLGIRFFFFFRDSVVQSIRQKFNRSIKLGEK